MDVIADPRVASLRRWSIASMVANALLIVTGALVRLTKSGLGCPTWPKCKDSYLPDQALGIHGVIEFGNRTLTFVLIALALITFLVARRVAGPLRRPAVRMSFAIGLGIIAQGVVGGLSVLTKLNPWVVSLHLVLSLVLVAMCAYLVHLTSPREAVPLRGRDALLGYATVAMSYVVMLLGTVVTGSGPNAGDDGARRNGLGLFESARVHGTSMWLLVALTVACIVILRQQPAGRVAVGLLAVELLMGLIGYLQYFNGLPVGLVIAHMTGVALFAIAVAHLLFAIRPVRPLRPVSAVASASPVQPERPLQPTE